ncbi:MAG: HK97 gp10 family phage protein, partial [bacterium]|nr:HK97 gp10 family phage protein [bacterium]
MKLPDEFMDKLSKLGDKFDSVAPKVLEAGGEVVLSQMKDNLRNVIGKNTKVKSRSTGALEKSLGITPALQDRKGEWN